MSLLTLLSKWVSAIIPQPPVVISGGDIRKFYAQERDIWLSKQKMIQRDDEEVLAVIRSFVRVVS
jgi:hypothetical protein